MPPAVTASSLPKPVESCSYSPQIHLSNYFLASPLNNMRISNQPNISPDLTAAHNPDFNAVQQHINHLQFDLSTDSVNLSRPNSDEILDNFEFCHRTTQTIKTDKQNSQINSGCGNGNVVFSRHNSDDNSAEDFSASEVKESGSSQWKVRRAMKSSLRTCRKKSKYSSGVGNESDDEFDQLSRSKYIHKRSNSCKNSNDSSHFHSSSFNDNDFVSLKSGAIHSCQKDRISDVTMAHYDASINSLISCSHQTEMVDNQTNTVSKIVSNNRNYANVVCDINPSFDESNSSSSLTFNSLEVTFKLSKQLNLYSNQHHQQQQQQEQQQQQQQYKDNMFGTMTSRCPHVQSLSSIILSPISSSSSLSPSSSSPSSSTSINSDQEIEKAHKLLTSPVDKYDNTQLHLEIKMKNFEKADKIISQVTQFSDLNVQNSFGQTPLHLAVLSQNADLVRELMVAGSTVYIQDDTGNTPLHLACEKGLSDIVHYLLTPVYYQEKRNNKFNYQIPFIAVPQDLTITNYDNKTCLELARGFEFESRIETLCVYLGNSNDNDYYYEN